ncbi:MAG: universal stress protein [Acidobacteriota bacterium]
MIALERVLVATDFSPASSVAVTYGRALSRAYNAKLTVLHVVDDLSERLLASAVLTDSFGDLGKLQRELEADGRRRISEVLSDEDRSDLHAEAVCVTSRSIAAAIVQCAKDRRIDLLVIGTHGRGLISHLLLGSVAERVLRLAPCPVLTVRDPERDFVLPDALQTVARV